jgi:tellurite resistance protein TehA-like permease
MLLLLGVWRYVYKRVALRYDAQYWGAVFPLGMYATSTHEMAQSLGLGFLAVLGRVFLYVALAAWAAAFIGLLRQLAGRARAVA